jgi:hypothetical protein
VAEAIESALAQAGPACEVMVFDDGSRDATPAVLDRFGDRIRRAAGPARGSQAARNRLLALARGAWLQFLDADDVLLPGKLARQLEAGLREGADVVVSPCLDDAGRVRHAARSRDLWVSLFRTELGVTSANLYRAEALRAAGGWDEAQRLDQDYRLLHTLLARGARVAVLGEPLCLKRRVNRQGLWRRAWQREPEAALAASLALVEDGVRHLDATGQLSPERAAAAGTRLFVLARLARKSGADAGRVLDAARALGLPRAALVSERPGWYRALYSGLGFAAAERADLAVSRWRRKRTRRGARARAAAPEGASR